MPNRSSAVSRPRVRWCAREAHTSEASAASSSSTIVIVIVTPPGVIIPTAAATAARPVLLVTLLTVSVLSGASAPLAFGLLQVNLVALTVRVTVTHHFPVHELTGLATRVVDSHLFQRLENKQRWLKHVVNYVNVEYSDVLHHKILRAKQKLTRLIIKS